MTVDPDKTKYRSVLGGQTFYFCSAGCKDSFDKDPAKYIGGAKAGHGSA
ncbi:MAG: YHS domain-containing protein [Candidatus Dormibacteraeota bacterium]|nr:YHS domain-containing protein [Candidatus Dormibacteraeota bacterium]